MDKFICSFIKESPSLHILTKGGNYDRIGAVKGVVGALRGKVNTLGFYHGFALSLMLN